jgi:hypothetical protein
VVGAEVRVVDALEEVAGSKRANAPIIKTVPAPMATIQAETGKFRVFILMSNDAGHRPVFNLLHPETDSVPAWIVFYAMKNFRKGQEETRPFKGQGLLTNDQLIHNQSALNS